MHNSVGMVGEPPVELREPLVLHVINFVYDNLANWRDYPPGVTDEAENDLTGKLSDYLTAEAQGDELFFFRLEERQKGRSQIDMAAKPAKGLFALLYQPDRYHPITVFEAKRLPAPRKDRLKEYLTGGAKMAGGVQRFKAGVHGAKHDVVAMIGFIQQYDALHHLETLNNWIAEFADSPVDKLTWDISERLKDFMYDAVSKTARSVSIHPRDVGKQICLHHLWVELSVAAK